ncbi:MAG: hypothetical protein KAU21_15610 [Gammaproteobacteria bacterium]|nr:hypothetical protein [Gammaproteobacteria bacterium]
MFLVPHGASASSALDYDARLCSVELVILQADLQRLQSTSTAKNHQTGLQQRITGALGTLGWLCRRYASKHKLNPAKTRSDIDILSNNFQQQKLEQFDRQLEALTENMPLSLKGYLPEDATAQSTENGKKIYFSYCSGCHLNPDLTKQRPAFSLVNMAGKLSQREFIARMIGGVRGTPEIALHNPLSKQDIAGMYAYLLQAGIE